MGLDSILLKYGQALGSGGLLVLMVIALRWMYVKFKDVTTQFSSMSASVAKQFETVGEDMGKKFVEVSQQLKESATCIRKTKEGIK